MSFNSKQYLAYEEARLEPTSVIITGNRRRYTTTMADKWKWLESLTPEQRERLKTEIDNEAKHQSNDWQ